MLQRTLTRALNHRAICHRIAEWDAQFDNVGARGDCRKHDVTSCVYDLVFAECGGWLGGLRGCVRWFEWRDNSLGRRERRQSFQRLLVRRGGLLGALRAEEGRVFWAENGVIEARRNGMGQSNLAIRGLQNVGIRTLQDSGQSSAGAGGVFAQFVAASGGFNV